MKLSYFRRVNSAQGRAGDGRYALRTGCCVANCLLCHLEVGGSPRVASRSVLFSVSPRCGGTTDLGKFRRAAASVLSAIILLYPEIGFSGQNESNNNCMFIETYPGRALLLPGAKMRRYSRVRKIPEAVSKKHKKKTSTGKLETVYTTRSWLPTAAPRHSYAVEDQTYPCAFRGQIREDSVQRPRQLGSHHIRPHALPQRIF